MNRQFVLSCIVWRQAFTFGNKSSDFLKSRSIQANGLECFYRMHARPHHCIQFCCFGKGQTFPVYEQFSNSIITEKEGTILSAHCLGCKAGLAESCSHVSSVLFYLEAWTKINGRLSCTLAKRLWLLLIYIKQVEYEKVPEINLTLARKMENDSDAEIENLCCSLKLFLSLFGSWLLHQFISLSLLYGLLDL